jgi:tryptophan synthase beta chain
MKQIKTLMTENEIPRAWYNIQADLPVPLPPPLHPGTLKPIGPSDLAPLFPEALIAQEVSRERFIEIPEEVRDTYRLWRPTPLHRARRLEQALKTPARIYYKNESTSPSGSHKANTAIAQAYYNKMAGVRRLVTETGAGQWGSALALASKLFGLECVVFMVRVSYDQKPYRRLLMETFGSTVHASPSDQTGSGRAILRLSPKSTGSLGIAISEAVEMAAASEDTKYSLGSVLNHVLLHQTVIGLEARQQFEQLGEYPDILIGCVGGGSNFSGFVFPFMPERLNGSKHTRMIAVEPSACPTLTRGTYSYDFGDSVGLTPLMKMYTLGNKFMPAPIHAGGLRYHGAAPLLCLLRHEGLIEAVAVAQTKVFEAAILFAQTEGIIPAPESAHAIRVAVDEAIRCRETGEKTVIAFALSGHGHFDLAAYEAHLTGRLQDQEFNDAEIEQALISLPNVDAA